MLFPFIRDTIDYYHCYKSIWFYLGVTVAHNYPLIYI